MDTDDDRVRDTGLPAPTPAARLGRSLPGLCLHRVHAHRAGPPDEGGPKAGGAGAPELVSPSPASSRRRAPRTGDPIGIHELSGRRRPSPAPGPTRVLPAAPGRGPTDPHRSRAGRSRGIGGDRRARVPPGDGTRSIGGRGGAQVPYRRCRTWKSRIARRKSSLVSPGHMTSAKYSSAYAACHRRKFEIRSSPLVRKTRSGSGSSAV